MLGFCIFDYFTKALCHVVCCLPDLPDYSDFHTEFNSFSIVLRISANILSPGIKFICFEFFCYYLFRICDCFNLFIVPLKNILYNLFLYFIFCLYEPQFPACPHIFPCFPFLHAHNTYSCLIQAQFSIVASIKKFVL